MKTAFGMAALAALVANGVALDCTGECLAVANTTEMDKRMEIKIAYHESKLAERASMRANPPPKEYSPCVNGMAGDFFPCSGVDMLSSLSLEDLGGNPSRGFDGNDIWGWEDPATGKEYALVGRMDGTTIVDVTDPYKPLPVFKINSRVSPSTRAVWRDVKVYKNTAYIVADALNGHGVQVFDLERVRSWTPSDGLVTASPDFLYSNMAAHNIFINEDSGYGMVVGARSTCRGGIHLIDLSNRLAPTFAGCYSADGYTHDIECVVYKSSYPDSAFAGKEICFAYNEDTLTIVDITDKSVNSQNEISAVQLARLRYSGVKYSHQGWLTDDGKYVLLDDEGDESGNPTRTKTYIFNVESLRNPQLISVSDAPSIAVDHNLYIKGDKAYMANYASGLRINDISNLGSLGSSDLTELAYFDTFPQSKSTATFDGIWSSYIFLPSGNLLLGSIEYGLIVVRETSLPPVPPPTPTPPTPTPPTPTPPTPTPPTPTPPTPTPPTPTPPTPTPPTPTPPTPGPVCEDTGSCGGLGWLCWIGSVRESCQLTCGVCTPLTAQGMPALNTPAPKMNVPMAAVSVGLGASFVALAVGFVAFKVHKRRSASEAVQEEGTTAVNPKYDV